MSKLQFRIILVCSICFAFLASNTLALAKSKSGKRPKTYFSVSGLLFNVGDQSESIAGTLIESDTDLGFGGAFAVGIKLKKGFRAEIEYAYRKFDFDVLANSAKVSEASSTSHAVMTKLGLLVGYRYFLIDYDGDDTKGSNFEIGMRLFF
jgi:hypothetical protein